MSPAASPDAVFTALSDPTRRAIFLAVVDRGPVSATGLAPQFGVSRQAIVRHLGNLRDAGLVDDERAGREVRFRARTEPLLDVARWIAGVDQQWAARLARLEAVTSNEAGTG